jgi:hypothetical protein
LSLYNRECEGIVMNGMLRAFATLLAAGVAGFLLWTASHFDRTTTGGYWAALGIIAAGGLLLGVAQMRGAKGNPPGMFLLAFLPIAIVAGWVLVTAQPAPNWFADHLGAWSRDIGIGDVVARLGQYLDLLAFGMGFVLGLTLEPAARRRAERPAVTPAAAAEPDAGAADAPTTAERREQAAAAEEETPARKKTTTRTVRG